MAERYRTGLRITALVGMACLSGSAMAQNNTCGPTNGAGTFLNDHGEFVVNGGQVSMAGATLFVDFFTTPSSTLDWNDVDGDGFAGYDPFTFPLVDQLASQFTPGSDLTTWWMFQYRSVGSVQGFNEFVGNQTCFAIPKTIPSETGVFNGLQYANAGVVTWSGPIANASGTPFEPCEIEGAFLDVPASFAVQVPGEPAWNRTPTSPGYGLNPIPSSTGIVSNLLPLSRECGVCSVSGDPCVDDTACPDGEVCNLTGEVVSLNTNTASPDENTIFDVVAAYVPVTLIANRGTDVENIKYSEAQHLFVTGRMPNGENLTSVTRDVGSGTRNAAMSSLGIDTSWGRGDNIGERVDDRFFTSLGADTQPTNCGGSSILENSVENRRLAIGYTGLAGGSRSAADALAGRYEILNTCKDVPATGQPACDCNVSGYVRPGVDTVLDNCDPCTSYQIAGQGSFSFRGNPNANRDPSDPKFENSEPLDNQAVADYVNNILDSIDAFEGEVQRGECNESRVCSLSGDPCTADGDCAIEETCELKICDNDGDCPNEGDFCKSKLNMPGQLLATQFFLPAGLDCINELTEPLKFVPTATNEVLKEFIRSESVITVPDYGTINPAGKVPKRNALNLPDRYSDGSVTGSYRYWTGSSFASVISGLRLSERNQVQGDFSGDFVRDVVDAAELVAAYYTPRAWQQSAIAQGSGLTGDMSDDNAIPEVLGDFNGDGNLTKEDLRYFADGLAMVPVARSASGATDMRLDRKQGHIAVDNAIAALGEPFPWADTQAQLLVSPSSVGDEPTFVTPFDINDPVAPFLRTGKSYTPGDFRGDVAGANPVAGAQPLGWDGVVDDADIDYVCRNLGDWSNLNEAVFMDLSCDMNGDTAVNFDDVRELVEQILGTQLGDADLDGNRDADDEAIVLATISAGGSGCNADSSCGWRDGDFNCDGIVDQADLTAVNDSDGDGIEDSADNCPDVANADQQDFDSDGDGDACDEDVDDDGVANEADVCDFTPLGANVQADGGLSSDLDGDCDVDLEDYVRFQEDYTGPNP